MERNAACCRGSITRIRHRCESSRTWRGHLGRNMVERRRIRSSYVRLGVRNWIWGRTSRRGCRRLYAWRRRSVRDGLVNVVNELEIEQHKL